MENTKEFMNDEISVFFNKCINEVRNNDSLTESEKIFNEHYYLETELSVRKAYIMYYEGTKILLENIKNNKVKEIDLNKSKFINYTIDIINGIKNNASDIEIEHILYNYTGYRGIGLAKIMTEMIILLFTNPIEMSNFISKQCSLNEKTPLELKEINNKLEHLYKKLQEKAKPTSVCDYESFIKLMKFYYKLCINSDKTKMQEQNKPISTKKQVSLNTIEFIKENFLGTSYTEQQQILEYLMKFLKENKNRKLSRDFNNTFNNYLEKIKSLLEFKENYKEFNSDKRRLTRKILLDNFKEVANNHHIDNSDERVRQHFNYFSEYYEEYKIYFEAKQVSSDIVQKFLIDYSNLDIDKKYKFIDDMIFYYSRINQLSLPYPNNMLNDYKPIIKSLIGDDLMKYYNCLYKEEQMQLILNLVNNFNWFKFDTNYYNREFKGVKENPKIIRTLKKETIKCCEKKFF